VARHNIRKEAFRAAIVDAASSLFIERGFGGTNIGDIAKSLGVTRSAVYYYFKNKQAILETLTREITLVASQRTTQATANLDAEPTVALRNLLRDYIALVLAHPLQFRVVERNETSLPVRQQSTARRARRNVLDNFSAAIERGIKAGDFRPVDARLAAFALIGMCNWTAWWFKPAGRKTESEIIETFVDMAVHAVARDEDRRPKKAALSDMMRIVREDLDHLEHLLPANSDGANTELKPRRRVLTPVRSHTHHK